MNVLFLSLSRMKDFKGGGIYIGLLREFVKRGHHVYMVSPAERRFHEKTSIIEEGNFCMLRVRSLNIQKANIIEKGIGTMIVSYLFYNAIKKYYKGIHFDIILYPTPPITLVSAVVKLKKEYGTPTYLLLKDIFPQNAVDLGMFKKGSFFYRIFRKQEKRLYEVSDHIGCMSPANVEYLKLHNTELPVEKIEVNPNSFPVSNDKVEITDEEKKNIRIKYNVPIEKTVFIYGGNLGKPQGLDFLLKVIENNEKEEKVFYLIVGDGTEYQKIETWFKEKRPNNAKLIARLPKNDYDMLAASCDVGLIFLDPRFTIPNYPSRLLAYLQGSKPVLCAIDKNTDIGTIAQNNGYGFLCENGDSDSFEFLVQELLDAELRKKMGEAGHKFFLENYTTERSYEIIMNHFRHV